MPHIELNHVTKKFGVVVAVNDLCLKIEKGECFSFLGPSGCGKTTTLRMLAGFEDLDEGEIVVGGKLISSSHKKYYLPPENRDFGMVFQAFAVWPHLNVFENVAFPLRIKKFSRAEITERTRKALRYTSLSNVEASYPNELSGGEKQRIALARALAINPTVMLLDEPLSNLDPHLREEMRFEIKDLQRQFGFSIIYVTHDQAEAMALSDRIMVMCDGTMQQVGTPLDVYNKPANKFVFSFIGLSNFIPAEVAGGAAYVQGMRGTDPVTRELPGHVREGGVTLACRPSEIDFTTEGGVPGIVKRKAYLGELIDYRVHIGDLEVRVQKLRRHGLLNEGETCRLKFQRLLWYDTGTNADGLPESNGDAYTLDAPRGAQVS
ncbi:MAG: ABC transporter ATP-binding protein [Syntrophobacteraceae bacterium]